MHGWHRCANRVCEVLSIGMRRSASRSPCRIAANRSRMDTPQRRLTTFEEFSSPLPAHEAHEHEAAVAGSQGSLIDSQPSMAARWDGCRLAPTPPCRAVSSAPDTGAGEAAATTASRCSETCLWCLEDLQADDVQNPIWQWPCPYSCRLHASCAVQIRIDAVNPTCPQCRSPRPGASADISLRNFCAQSISRAGEFLHQIHGSLCHWRPTTCFLCAASAWHW